MPSGSVARFVLRLGRATFASRATRRRSCSGTRDRPRRWFDRLRGSAHRAPGGGRPATSAVGDTRRGPTPGGRRARPRRDADHQGAARRARSATLRLKWSAARSSVCRHLEAVAATSSVEHAMRSSSRPTSSSTSAPSSSRLRRRVPGPRAFGPRSPSSVRRRVSSSSRRRSSIRSALVAPPGVSTPTSSAPSTRP
jgi:hypothetical protein